MSMAKAEGNEEEEKVIIAEGPSRRGWMATGEDGWLQAQAGKEPVGEAAAAATHTASHSSSGSQCTVRG